MSAADGGRRRQNLSVDREREILSPLLARARKGGILVVPPIKAELEAALFGRISDVRRCWAPLPMRPLCRAMLTHEYSYACGAVDVVSGELDALILPHVNSACTQLFLDEVATRHPAHRIIMVLDGAGWHRSATLKVLSDMRLLRLPPSAPELNPVEHSWEELREKYVHNKAFDSREALEDQLAIGLIAIEQDQPRVQSIVAWDWIINALMKWKWN